VTDLLQDRGPGEARTDVDSRLERSSEPSRIILFIGANGIVSDRLLHALTLEFPTVVIESVDDLPAACRTFGHPVALILVDTSLIASLEQASSELRRLHPRALTAVIQRDDLNHVRSLSQILAFPSVRSILPMNVGLDVWLSVLRLMLCGGEYFPPGMFHSYARSLGDVGGVPSYGVPAGRDGKGPVADLTAREVQILEMVARGLQNKTIAAELRLSEHTVKIHLHNIISKLGAHNRTEAVAKFRHFRARGLTSNGNGYWSSSS